GDRGDRVLQDLLELGPRHVRHHRHEVGERRDRERVQFGHRPRRDQGIVPDTAAVLQRHLRRSHPEVARQLLPGGQQRVGEQVTQIGLLGTHPWVTPALQGYLRGGQHVLGQLLDVRRDRLYHRALDPPVRSHRVRSHPGDPYQATATVHTDDMTVPVEGDHQPAHVLVVTWGGHHRYLHPGGIGDEQWVAQRLAGDRVQGDLVPRYQRGVVVGQQFVPATG